MKFIESLKEYPFTYFLLVTTITTVVVVINVFDFINLINGSLNWKIATLCIFAMLIYFGVYKEVWK